VLILECESCLPLQLFACGSGRELAMGRNLKPREQLGEAAQLTFAKASPGIERDEIKTWIRRPSAKLPSRATAPNSLVSRLVDDGESVAIRLFDAEQAAQSAMHQGVVRLLRLALKEQIKQLEKGPGNFNQLAYICAAR